MEETRNVKFKRLATARTNAILDKLRLLGNLSNKINYDYSEEEVYKIFSAIDSQLKIIKAKFSGSTRREFKL